MKRRRLQVVVLVTVVATAGLVAANLAGGGPAPPAFDRVSNLGTSIAASPKEADVVQRIGRPLGDIKILNAQGGRSFYRVGEDCFGAGPTSASPYRLGHVACSRDFPSRDHPVLHFMAFRGKFINGKPTDVVLLRSEGIAVDGVAHVAFRTADGAIVGKIPVKGNTYKHSAIPEAALRELVAVDADGEIVSAEVIRSLSP